MLDNELNGAADADPTVTPAPNDPPKRRRRAASRPAGSPQAATAPAETTPEPAAEPAPAPAAENNAVVTEADAAPAKAPRRRATRKATAPATAPEPTAEPVVDPVSAEDPVHPAVEEAPKRRRTRKKVAETAPEPIAEPVAEPVAVEEAPEAEAEPVKPAKRTRKRVTKAAAAPEPVVEEVTPADEQDDTKTGTEVPGQTLIAIALPDEPIESAAAPFAERTEDKPAAKAPRAARRPVFQPLFQAPQAPVFAAPVAKAPVQEDPEPVADEEQDTREDDDARGGSRRRRARRARIAEPFIIEVQEAEEAEAAAAEHLAVEAAVVETGAETEAEPFADDEDDEDGNDRRRRRRRGGRRRRARGDEDGTAESDEDEDTSEEGDRTVDSSEEDTTADTADTEDEDDDESGSASSRRRRRRRRRTGTEDEPVAADDPERTVVKVREPRKARTRGGDSGSGSAEPRDANMSEDGVTSIKGSTRLEAKKVRRREGREAGRRRVPIVTEAEFLARREAVERVMVVRQAGERTQIGVLEDNVLVEHYVNKEQSSSYVGNVYLGKVQNVLPSMEAAFVDIGKGRNAVLYAGEVAFGGNGPRRIESVLKPGQTVLVQVTKDPIGHKGARLTGQISLPGRYMVYVPQGSMTGISRKLPDVERNRLKQILKKVVPEDGGVIVRTAAEGASEEELARDVERLHAQYEEIQRKSQQITSSVPSLVYGEPEMRTRVVRDIFNEDFSKLIVSGDEAWSEIYEYVHSVAPDLAPRLSRWTSDVDVFSTYRIDEQLMKALDRKVWLPSGGSLVIDRTEAMVVVDVNTGKFTGQGGNLEETVTRNNLEAAEEIVNQLRLRDLGGIIVVDFIDMVLESNRELVLRRLIEALGRDRTKHQVAEVTSLGLVQMTRKRVGQGLLESFSETCHTCNGRGVVVHMDLLEEPKEPKAKKQSANGNNGNNGNGNGAKAVEKIVEVHEVHEVHEAPAVTVVAEEAPQESVSVNGSKRRRKNKAAKQADESIGTLVTEEADPGFHGIEATPGAVVESDEPEVPAKRTRARKAAAKKAAVKADAEAVAAVEAEPVAEAPAEPAKKAVRARRKAVKAVSSPTPSQEPAPIVVEAVVVPVPVAESVVVTEESPAPRKTARKPSRRATRPAGAPVTEA